jgi:hypothetical protein
MKTIQHSIFTDSVTYSILAWNAHTRRERSRERVRQRAEQFINEIGVDSVLSVSEHASTFGPFSVVVWWHRELPDQETLVIRASDESKAT